MLLSTAASSLLRFTNGPYAIQNNGDQIKVNSKCQPRLILYIRDPIFSYLFCGVALQSIFNAGYASYSYKSGGIFSHYIRDYANDSTSSEVVAKFLFQQRQTQKNF